MCRVDLKDAYLTIPINSEYKKFLKFQYKNRIFQFTTLPFGLSSSPYIFTKVMKPVINFIRQAGIKSIVYLDDFLIFGKSKKECIENTNFVIQLLCYLRFVVNIAKSSLTPSTKCKFLGFILDSENMLISLPSDK